jgi:bifunctional DNA-binding transcriptional regulator/antitoxin component of YhaV-PrlF toxin-antitoxin module
MVSKVWETMNELEMITSKICSAREIIDAAIDRIQEHQYDKAETMMSAAYEFLGYYLDEFDEKFKLAWQETVVVGKEENIAFFNVDTAGNMTPSYISPVTCDKNDNSPECKGAWNNFWDSEEVSDDCMPPWGHSDMEYLIANRKKDEVKKWVLPVEEVENGDTGKQEYFITFPDDLLEAANLKEGDQIEWVDKGDGSFLLKKSWSDPYRDKMLAAGYKMVDGVWTLKKVPQTYDEMIVAGYTMTDDGFWIKEN